MTNFLDSLSPQQKTAWRQFFVRISPNNPSQFIFKKEAPDFFVQKSILGEKIYGYNQENLKKLIEFHNNTNDPQKKDIELSSRDFNKIFEALKTFSLNDLDVGRNHTGVSLPDMGEALSILSKPKEPLIPVKKESKAIGKKDTTNDYAPAYKPLTSQILFGNEAGNINKKFTEQQKKLMLMHDDMQNFISNLGFSTKAYCTLNDNGLTQTSKLEKFYSNLFDLSHRTVTNDLVDNHDLLNCQRLLEEAKAEITLGGQVLKTTGDIALTLVPVVNLERVGLYVAESFLVGKVGAWLVNKSVQGVSDNMATTAWAYINNPINKQTFEALADTLASNFKGDIVQVPEHLLKKIPVINLADTALAKAKEFMVHSLQLNQRKFYAMIKDKSDNLVLQEVKSKIDLELLKTMSVFTMVNGVLTQVTLPSNKGYMAGANKTAVRDGTSVNKPLPLTYNTSQKESPVKKILKIPINAPLIK